MKRFPLLLFVCLGTQAPAGPFSPGNLVVCQVGDGVASLTHAATRTFFKEFSTTGSLVQTIDLTSLASPHRFVNSGLATQDLSITRTLLGDFVFVTGFDTTVGTAAVATTSAVNVPRALAAVSSNGDVNTSTALTDAFSGGSMRSAATLDGLNFWLTGTHGEGQEATAGIRYCVIGSSVSTQVAADPPFAKVAGIFGGQLYCTSANNARYGISTVGTGLPTTGGQSVNLMSGFPTGGASPNDFWFVDANTVYVAEDNNTSSAPGVQKWVRTGTVWNLSYALNVGLNGAVRRIAVRQVSGQAEIFALTAEATANRLVRVVDAGPQSQFTVLSQAAVRTAWRGINWVPTATGTKVVLTTYIVHQGFEISGSIGSFAETDGDFMVLFNDEETLTCELELIGRAAVSSPTSIRFVASQFAGRPGLSVALKANNYTTNRYDELAGGPALGALQVLQATVTSAADRYLSPNREMRMKLIWQPINDEDPTQDGWPLSVELVNWFIS